ncbi:hypothetical protein QQS21_011983 [Conoideocrella luteorostrata]|uniref:SMP-30/Gluconolactonase/LRE-like region domain-containing protein n=1 Tax=Conoideocrella luteorostrata TaxID=1105319 RepID=A0AAJ0FVB2_9HYPO|nr:hypothetical protein QQS21_011983 [Conoideocrella luteorostrata]
MSVSSDGFRAHDPSFQDIIGSSPSLEKILSNPSYPFAHEAGVFFSDANELWVTSNRIYDDKGEQHIIISKIRLSANRDAPPVQEEVTIEQFHMGNGGVNYGSGILFCSQGSATIPSGLYYTDPKATRNTKPILTSVYGKPFNSVNDVVIAQDGSIWFTDPPYGFEQGYKECPQLPSQLYRYSPTTKAIRALADGFGHPNGLCFSPDEKTLYVTDTDKVHGSGVLRPHLASSMYVAPLG